MKTGQYRKYVKNDIRSNLFFLNFYIIFFYYFSICYILSNIFLIFFIDNCIQFVVYSEKIITIYIHVEYDLSGIASQLLSDKLRNLILEGDFKAGEQLQESRVANLTGVSRTPARIALRALASEGLLTYKPNCGYFVCAVTLERMMEAYALRAELEAFACATVAKKGISNDVKMKLKDCLATGDKILSGCKLQEENRERYRAMNRTFHNTIIYSTGNELLEMFVQQANNIPLASNRMVVWTDYSVVKRSHEDHHRILRALLEKDAIRAKALMLEHIYFASEYLRTHLAKTYNSLISKVNSSTSKPA